MRGGRETAPYRGEDKWKGLSVGVIVRWNPDRKKSKYLFMSEGILPRFRVEELAEKRKNIVIEKKDVNWFFKELKGDKISQKDLFGISREERFREKRIKVTKTQVRWLLEELDFVGISVEELKNQVKKYGGEDEDFKRGENKFLVRFIDGFVLRNDRLPCNYRAGKIR